jgi:ABC-type nitrate/sulfonate/bicarbonate transport system substrate-binding protein
VYCVRKDDLADPKMRQIYQKFLQGVVMGFEFAKANPRAAAQITYEQFPALKSQMKPQVALVSMMQNAHLYGLSEMRGSGWGFHYTSSWQSYLNVIYKLGQIPKPLSPNDVLTNELVGPANKNADVARAQKDAASFKLNADFANTTPPSDLTL